MTSSLCKTRWLTLMRLHDVGSKQSCYLIQFRPPVRSICTVLSPPSHPYSFTISDLIDGPRRFPIPESVIARFQSSKNPKLVLKLLQDHDFSESQVKFLVSRWPLVLLAKPDKTLQPKIEFLRSVGLSGPDIVKIIIREPFLLARSLKGHIIPIFDFLQNLFRSKEDAATVFKRCPLISRYTVKSYLELNIATLHNFGVPDSRISKLVLRCPFMIMTQPPRLMAAAIAVKEMGFNPKLSVFGIAVTIMGWSSRSTWEAKLDVFRSYGLSDDEIYVAFKKQPMFLTLREKKVRATMDLFIKKLCWSPSKVLTMPGLLLLSLEGRIVPRLSVLHVLVSEKLLEKCSSINSVLKMSEKNFVQKFMIKYQDEFPRVLEAYQGSVKIDEFNIPDKNSYDGRIVEC